MQTNARLLSPRTISGTDPLLRALHGRMRLSPWGIMWVGWLFGLLYMICLPWAFGFLLPRRGIVASSTDVFNQINFFIVFPAVAFYYLWQPSKIASTYAALFLSIRGKKEASAELTDAIGKIQVRPVWWVGCLLVAAVGIGAGIVDNISKLGLWWYAANGWMIAGLQLSRGFVFYMIAIIYSRHIIASKELARIYRQFEFPSPILPASQARGIPAVANYASTFILFTAVVGLNIGLTPILSTRPEVAYPYEAALYLILSVIGFLLPLWGAHGAMAAQKSRIIDDLSTQYQEEFSRVLATVAGSGQETDDSFKRLKAIETAYGLAAKSWAWPFDTAVLLKVGGTMLAPFALVAGQLVQRLVGNLILDLFGP